MVAVEISVGKEQFDAVQMISCQVKIKAYVFN